MLASGVAVGWPLGASLYRIASEWRTLLFIQQVVATLGIMFLNARFGAGESSTSSIMP